MKRATIYSLILLVSSPLSCAPPTRIIREASSTVKPDWVMQPPKSRTSLYFVGLRTDVETLEEGQEAALHDAIAKIATFLGTKVESLFEEHTTELDQQLKQQITAKSTARVFGANVVDSYHEKLTRIDKNFRLEKYDVYVLVSFPKAQIEKERVRQQQDKIERVSTAYKFYRKGKNQEKRKSYVEAKEYYKQALKTLNDLDDVVLLDREGIQNSRELGLLIERDLHAIISRMRQFALSITIHGPQTAGDVFRSHFVETLQRHGFHVTDDNPEIDISANASVSKSSFVMNNFVYYAEGNVSAHRRSDRKAIATVPFQVKGFHHNHQQAALNAVAEAGNEVGENLARILLEREASTDVASRQLEELHIRKNPFSR